MRRMTILCCGLAFAFAGHAEVPRLAPPQSSTLLARTVARGVQIYVCTAKNGVLAWDFKAPEADLVGADGKPFAHHFVGPSWQAPDGSAIIGVVLAKAPAPRPDAIPWLLLSTRATSTGAGTLADVRYVQRVETSGGVGPTGGCTIAGETRRVPYTATYVFYR